MDCRKTRTTLNTHPKRGKQVAGLVSAAFASSVPRGIQKGECGLLVRRHNGWKGRG
jgi:hypothetical protein